MIPLTNKEIRSYEKQKVCHLCKKKFCFDENEKNKFKLYQKVRDHCHYTGKVRGTAHNICNLRYNIPKEIPVISHNCSTYDDHFIINHLAEEFDGDFDCIGENMEKCITFFGPINKESDNGETVIYKLNFINSYRFMPTSLPNLVDNLSGIKKENANHSWKEKISNQNAIVLILKVID